MAVTTLMFKNVPCRFDNATLLREVEGVVGQGLVEFVLLPWDGSSRNMGYSFVNFVNAAAAGRARASMDGSYWSTDELAKPVKIMDAELQGLVPNLAFSEHMIRTAHKAPVHPLVILGGREVDFWEAAQLLLPGRAGGSASSSRTEAGEAGPAPEHRDQLQRRTERSGAPPAELGRPDPSRHAPRALGSANEKASRWTTATPPHLRSGRGPQSGGAFAELRAAAICSPGYHIAWSQVRALALELLRRMPTTPPRGPDARGA